MYHKYNLQPLDKSPQRTLVTTECPSHQTAISAVSLAHHASGIHQKRSNRAKGLPCGIHEESHGHDGLLQGFLTLNITQITPTVKEEQISCQPASKVAVLFQLTNSFMGLLELGFGL
ncbi:uncharacterized [Tachysurus ichikawai]